MKRRRNSINSVQRRLQIEAILRGLHPGCRLGAGSGGGAQRDGTAMGSRRNDRTDTAEQLHGGRRPGLEPRRGRSSDRCGRHCRRDRLCFHGASRQTTRDRWTARQRVVEHVQGTIGRSMTPGAGGPFRLADARSFGRGALSRQAQHRPPAFDRKAACRPRLAASRRSQAFAAARPSEPSRRSYSGRSLSRSCAIEQAPLAAPPLRLRTLVCSLLGAVCCWSRLP